MSFEKNIFINCPFDITFQNNILKPILFSLLKIGFTPRLSLEASNSAEFRLTKITEIIKECQYSIHDLSKVKSTKANEFARMNMPFELGIDYGLRNSNSTKLSKKQFLILEAVRYDYMKALSDINGLDVKTHNNDTETLFECLYSWYSETLKITKQKPPLQTYYDFMDFNTSLFEEKLIEYSSEKVAKNYIEKISIPEYIQEIIERI